MIRTLLWTIALALAASTAQGDAGGEAGLLSGVRQITFEGKRAGEGYFNADGTAMIFQSERQDGNPFYQMYLLNLESGDIQRVSPGHGKTTCGWVHPKGRRVMFSSTHGDPQSMALQKAELDFRASGKRRRYSWDFDEHYEIYEYDLEEGTYSNLTEARGYDAEGSYSPDGRRIAFASNRHAYLEKLSDREAEIFGRDKSYMMDIYIMNADGSELRRLTEAPGYDGGPFFSADGEKIVWRRFAEDGVTAEVFTMNTDGSEKKQITRLGAMSWAPFFHPSGDYIVFANNLHGMRNFELYMVDSQGLSDPVRVTHGEGFDGLPAFSPDGGRIAWTSKRTSDKSAQIFIAEWNDDEARRLLGLGGGDDEARAPSPLVMTSATISPMDMRLHVSKLASGDMEGRLTGSDGARKAAEYLAGAFAAMGLEPAGDNNTFFQDFAFTAGATLGKENRLAIQGAKGETVLALDQDWRPLSFSRAGQVAPAGIAFAGYGIVAPAAGKVAAHDSYGGLDVTGKWVLVLRFLPEGVDPKTRAHLLRYADLRYKATVARRRGAAGLIVVSGPSSGVKEQLVRLAFDAGGASSATAAAVSISDDAAGVLLEAAGKDLKQLQRTLDEGGAAAGFLIPGVRLGGQIDIVRDKRTGRNVLARLKSGAAPGTPVLALGAHYDHLGHGEASGSLAREDERGKVHFGADDNASGVAGLIEIAQYFSALKAGGNLEARRDVLFAAWSGEELGLLGSAHFTNDLAGKAGGGDIASAIAAYLNMDMIGRLDENLYLQGVGSSPAWRSEIERRNVPVGLSVITSSDAYLPTDTTSFYLKGVPVLNAFTGAHSDYSTPRDTPDKVNFNGAARIARLIGSIALSLAGSEEAPRYVRLERPKGSVGRKHLRVYLGTIPDYGQGDIKGVRISAAAKGGPADKAGLAGGDVIVGLAGKEIEDIYAFVESLSGLKAGVAIPLTIMRKGEKVELTITPEARE